jgi:hypothetical protein
MSKFYSFDGEFDDDQLLVLQLFAEDDLHASPSSEEATGIRKSNSKEMIVDCSVHEKDATAFNAAGPLNKMNDMHSEPVIYPNVADIGKWKQS